jgi:hypothetical protein
MSKKVYRIEGKPQMSLQLQSSPVSEFIDPVFAKTSPKRSFSMTENEHFELVFAKTGSMNSGTVKVSMEYLLFKATFFLMLLL